MKLKLLSLLFMPANYYVLALAQFAAGDANFIFSQCLKHMSVGKTAEDFALNFSVS